MRSEVPSWSRRNRKLLFLCSALWFLLAVALGGPWLCQCSAADVYLGISRTEGQRINMATVGFSAKVAGPRGEDLNVLAVKILRSDMNLSAVISMVDPASLPFDPTLVRPGTEMEFLPRLSALSIQVMLAAELSQSENKLVLDAKLFDVSAKQQILHNRYMADMRGLASAIHRLSDDIIYYLTGERGICRTKLAFVCNKSGAKEIYVMDLDGNNIMQMTRNNALNLTPRWSPDGRFLAYVSYRDGNPDLYLLDATCGRRTKISSLPGLNISPSWSPDGKWIALALSKDGNTNIFLMRPEGAGLRQITNSKAICVSPSWSPNGRQIAFVSDQGGTPQIYVIDAEGTNVRRLTFQGNYNTSPAWSPKGDKIAFVSQQNGSLHLFVMHPDGSGLSGLTQGPGNNESPSWSPDGRYIAFSSTREGRSGIYIMREDGTGQRRLTPNDADYYTPNWSPR